MAPELAKAVNDAAEIPGDISITFAAVFSKTLCLDDSPRHLNSNGYCNGVAKRFADQYDNYEQVKYKIYIYGLCVFNIIFI